MAAGQVPYAMDLAPEWREPARVRFAEGMRDRGTLEYDDGTTVVFSLYQKYYAPWMCLMLGLQARTEQIECLYAFIPYSGDPSHSNYWKPELPRNAEQFCTQANTHGFQFRPTDERT